MRMQGRDADAAICKLVVVLIGLPSCPIEKRLYLCERTLQIQSLARGLGVSWRSHLNHTHVVVRCCQYH